MVALAFGPGAGRRVFASHSPRTVCHLPEIHGGLFLGSAVAAADALWLVRSGVSCVLNVAAEVKDVCADDGGGGGGAAALGLAGVSFVRLPLHENRPKRLRSELAAAVAELAGRLDAGCRVLVHCNAGRNRCRRRLRLRLRIR